MPVISRASVIVVHRAVEEPRAEPVHDQCGDGDEEHDPRFRRFGPFQLGDRFADDLRGRPQHERGVEDRRHRLGAAHAEGETRRRATNRDAHGDEAHRQGQDVHEQMERIGLENDAVRGQSAGQLDGEERRDEDEHHEETARLLRFAGRELAARAVLEPAVRERRRRDRAIVRVRAVIVRTMSVRLVVGVTVVIVVIVRVIGRMRLDGGHGL